MSSSLPSYFRSLEFLLKPYNANIVYSMKHLRIFPYRVTFPIDKFNKDNISYTEL